jgi:hypothetical protein
MKILKLFLNMFIGFACAAVVIVYIIAPALEYIGALP